LEPAIDFNAKALAEGWPFSCDPNLVFASPKLHAFYVLWQTKSAVNPNLTRADFGARELRPYLRNLAIHERFLRSDGIPRHTVRFFGSALAERVGEQTGKDLEEMVEARYLPPWLACFDATLAVRAPLRFVARFDVPRLAHLAGESVLCPLRAATGAGEQVLSITYCRSRFAGPGEGASSAPNAPAKQK
jgi:hypothetical protein